MIGSSQLMVHRINMYGSSNGSVEWRKPEKQGAVRVPARKDADGKGAVNPVKVNEENPINVNGGRSLVCSIPTTELIPRVENNETIYGVKCNVIIKINVVYKDHSVGSIVIANYYISNSGDPPTRFSPIIINNLDNFVDISNTKEITGREYDIIYDSYGSGYEISGPMVISWSPLPVDMIPSIMT